MLSLTLLEENQLICITGLGVLSGYFRIGAEVGCLQSVLSIYAIWYWSNHPFT